MNSTAHVVVYGHTCPDNQNMMGSCSLIQGVPPTPTSTPCSIGILHIDDEKKRYGGNYLVVIDVGDPEQCVETTEVKP